MSYLNLFKKKFNKKINTRSIIYALIIFLSTNILFVYSNFFEKNIPVYIISTLLIALILILGLFVIFIINKASGKFYFFPKQNRISKLKKRIIIAFSVGAALPTIIVAIFSTYFFYIGIELWFDKKISKVLTESVHIGEKYINEHTLQLKKTALSVAEDLNSTYFELINNQDYFKEFINAQAELRSFDEAIVFQKDTHNVLAQTNLSFSLSFITIPDHLLARAAKGEIIQISSDPMKIRILVRLQDHEETYLLIGRLIEPKIIEHISEANGTAQSYFRLKEQISVMQIKFSVIFICISLIFLLIATLWGSNFAARMVSPIKELVSAAEKVKNGDLSVQVPIKNLRKDEIKTLSSSFNRMVNQIKFQQQELIIAQRASAWSDVARRVAHEIKNPLTPIQLSTDRLQKKFKDEVEDKENFLKYTSNILKNTRDIRQIVSEFVDFARLPLPNFDKYELVSFLRDLVDSRKLINENINYYFKSNIKNLDFICDISQINRVFVNILLNAEEAFKKEQDLKDIKINILKNAYMLTVLIEDNGPGFDKKLLNSAKDAYITTKENGTGLGLAIVNRIISDHFGEFEISNIVTGGARIKLTFHLDKLINKLT